MAIYIGTKRIDGGGSSLNDPSTVKLNFDYYFPNSGDNLNDDGPLYNWDYTNSLLLKNDNSTNLYNVSKLAEDSILVVDNSSWGYGIIERCYDRSNWPAEQVKGGGFYINSMGDPGYNLVIKSTLEDSGGDNNYMYAFTSDTGDAIPGIYTFKFTSYTKKLGDSSAYGFIMPQSVGYLLSNTDTNGYPIVSYQGSNITIKPGISFYISGDSIINLENINNNNAFKTGGYGIKFKIPGRDSPILNKSYKEMFTATVVLPVDTSVTFEPYNSRTKIKYVKGYNDVTSDSSTDVMVYCILYDGSTCFINKNIYS